LASFARKRSEFLKNQKTGTKRLIDSCKNGVSVGEECLPSRDKKSNFENRKNQIKKSKHIIFYFN
jgi:hypothetical protein